MAENNSKMDNLFANSAKKDIPMTNSDNSKPSKVDYKTVRIHMDMFREFKSAAFYEDKSIVDVIRETLEYRQKHDQNFSGYKGG